MQGSFRCGKATKRSRYGSLSKDRTRRTLWSAELCFKAGLACHLIDAEWKACYMMPYEAEELTAHSEGLETILSYSTRHHNSLKLLNQTISGLENRKVGLNLIVGNPAYLSPLEARRPYFRTLVDVVKFVRQRFDDLPVFIGTEGLGTKAIELSAEYDLVPFLLLDRSLKEDIASAKDIMGNGEVALYAPYLISKNYPRLLRDILYRLSGYIMRRRWVKKEMKQMGYDPSVSTLRAVIQEKKSLSPKFIESDLGTFLKEAASHLAMYGDINYVSDRMTEQRKLGVTILMGFPIKENEEQILLLGECSSNLA